jgi:hypothetical protein
VSSLVTTLSIKVTNVYMFPVIVFTFLVTSCDVVLDEIVILFSQLPLDSRHLANHGAGSVCGARLEILELRHLF